MGSSHDPCSSRYTEHEVALGLNHDERPRTALEADACSVTRHTFGEGFATAKSTRVMASLQERYSPSPVNSQCITLFPLFTKCREPVVLVMLCERSNAVRNSCHPISEATTYLYVCPASAYFVCSYRSFCCSDEVSQSQKYIMLQCRLAMILVDVSPQNTYIQHRCC